MMLLSISDRLHYSEREMELMGLELEPQKVAWFLSYTLCKHAGFTILHH